MRSVEQSRYQHPRDKVDEVLCTQSGVQRTKSKYSTLSITKTDHQPGRYGLEEKTLAASRFLAS